MPTPRHLYFAALLCVVVALPATAGAQPLPERADCGAFNGWASGYGRVLQVTPRQMTVRWESATDGTLFLGRHTIRVRAGCHYWQATGRPIMETAPANVVLRTPSKAVFVAGVRPRRGQIISFLVWRLRTPLPASFPGAQVRRIYTTSAATTSAALTG